MKGRYWLDTYQEFRDEYGRDAIPLALHNDLCAVLYRVKCNNRPTIMLRTAIGLPEPLDQDVVISDGTGLDADDEGWRLVARDAVNNLRRLANRLEEWSADDSKDQKWYMDCFGLYDDGEVADEAE
jgi:hypothetical protein